MKKRQKGEPKNREPTPSDARKEFNKATKMEPDTGFNPIRKGIYGSKDGKRNPKLEILEIDGKSVAVNTTNIACLAAITGGINYGYNIRKIYDWKNTTVHNSLMKLILDGLVEPGIEPSSFKRNRTKTVHKLTELGEAVVKKLRESNNAFFAECEKWIAGQIDKETERVENLKIEGKNIALTKTSIACLAAITDGINHGYGIIKIYDRRRKHTTVHSSLERLVLDGLVEPGIEPSSFKRNRTKTVYKLTELGEAVVKRLRESNNAFYAECEAWLNAKKAENQS